VLAPLPNLLYQRDTSCWIYGGVTINAMRWPARIRETITGEAIYAGTRCSRRPASMSGITAATPRPPPSRAATSCLGDGAVLVGMSERTTPQAVEMLAHRLFAAAAARCLVAIDLPKTRAFMHLDTMMTMVNYGCSPSTRGWACCRPTRSSRARPPSELKVTITRADMHGP